MLGARAPEDRRVKPAQRGGCEASPPRRQRSQPSEAAGTPARRSTSGCGGSEARLDSLAVPEEGYSRAEADLTFSLHILKLPLAAFSIFFYFRILYDSI